VGSVKVACCLKSRIFVYILKIDQNIGKAIKDQGEVASVPR